MSVNIMQFQFSMCSANVYVFFEISLNNVLAWC